MQDWECIIVDDGSKDKTGAIADEYASRDPRFRVFHQQNGGVASARQKGLDNSIGEFTIHVDPDDWVESDMCDTLYKSSQQEQSDLVICDFIVILQNGEEKYWTQRPDSQNHIKVMGQMMSELYGSLCNKLIRRSCYTDYGIRFREDVTVCEDQLVVMSILAHPVKISYCNKAFYHYDQSKNATSFVNRETPVYKRLLPLEIISSYTDLTPVQDKFDNAIFLIAYHALYVPKEYCSDYNALFKKHKDSIKRAKAPIRSKVCVRLRLLGFRLPLPFLKRVFR